MLRPSFGSNGAHRESPNCGAMRLWSRSVHHHRTCGGSWSISTAIRRGIGTQSRRSANCASAGSVKINVPRQGEKRGPVDNLVTEIVTDHRLCWRSLSWYRFLVYGVRCRHLEAQSDGTTVFREVETMHGPLSGVIRRAMAPQLLRGLQAECDSLKEEVERVTTESQ